MFGTALFMIEKTWKQPKCSSADEWMNKMLYVCTIEHDSAIKRSEILIHAATWMKLENSLLSDRRKTERVHIIEFDLREMSRVAKAIVTGKC